MDIGNTIMQVTGPAFIAEWSRVLPLTASYRSPLPEYAYPLGQGTLHELA